MQEAQQPNLWRDSGVVSWQLLLGRLGYQPRLGKVSIRKRRANVGARAGRVRGLKQRFNFRTNFIITALEEAQGKHAREMGGNRRTQATRQLVGK